MAKAIEIHATRSLLRRRPRTFDLLVGMLQSSLKASCSRIAKLQTNSMHSYLRRQSSTQQPSYELKLLKSKDGYEYSEESHKSPRSTARTVCEGVCKSNDHTLKTKYDLLQAGDENPFEP
jgi:hypothetical protein